LKNYEQYLLYPKSVAIIGASKRQGTVGYNVMKCVVQGGFQGALYPVNPFLEELMGFKCYHSIMEVPGNVDMAVIIVPAQKVLEIAEECGEKGAHVLVVIADGFRETGAKGAALEKSLLEIIRRYGMRMIGPNCMGFINPDPEESLNASFSPVFPVSGSLAIISQSGALGATILEYNMSIDVGISFFVSVGNSADLKVIDFLELAESDPKTQAIMLYLESFDNPEEFAVLSRRISLSKPIVVIKTGRTQAGAKAALSHTGAMVSNEVAVEALFRKSGIIRVDTFQELIGASLLVSSQPLPRGRRVAILTQAGGAATLAADACERQNLLVPGLSEETKTKIKKVVSRRLGLNNPLDLTGGVRSEEFLKVAEILAEDDGNDILMCLWGPAVIIEGQEIRGIVEQLSEICRRHQKPLLTSYMIPDFKDRTRVGKKSRVPVFQFPEGAVLAISKFCDYVDAVKRIKIGTVPVFGDILRDRARRLIDDAQPRAQGKPFWLSAGEVDDLLACYGIKQAQTFTASSADEAAEIASRIGWPVAVKLFSTTITHKTEAGGVVLGLSSPEDVRKAFHDIYDRLEANGQENEMQGVIVQPMVEDGTELIIGITREALGPLIMLGSGGVYTEIIEDSVFRMCPLMDLDAQEMINSLKVSKLLRGFRNVAPGDIPALQDLLLRVSAMIMDIPEIGELDLNPVKVMPQGSGYRLVDARILIK
jgi:acetyltransferase